MTFSINIKYIFYRLFNDPSEVTRKEDIDVREQRKIKRNRKHGK